MGSEEKRLQGTGAQNGTTTIDGIPVGSERLTIVEECL